jgi:hypothetical protein
MLRDGTYAAWFRSALGQGTGMVDLVGGRISGRDSFFSYSGSYEVDGARVTARLSTRRLAEGPTTVLGFDEVDLTLAGMINAATVCCSGTARQAPGVQLEVTLLPSRDEEPRRPENRAPVAFNPAKLPRERDERSRGRNPFSPR